MQHLTVNVVGGFSEHKPGVWTTGAWRLIGWLPRYFLRVRVAALQ